MALSTKNNNGVKEDAPTYQLLINGVPVEEATPVLGMAVFRAFNRISTAKVIVKDGSIGGGKIKKTDFAIQNKPDFAPGNVIQIKIGHRGHNDHLVFTGVITGLQIRIRQGTSRLIVECKSEAFRMALQPKSRYFLESTDSDIITDLLQEYGLNHDVQNTAFTHQELVQYEATDWAFLVNRAEENGLFVYIDGEDQINVQPLNFLQAPLDILEYGKNIYELDARMDARLQYEGAKVKAWDFNQQAIVEQDAIPPNLSEPGNLSGEALAEVGNAGSRTIRHSGYKLDGELQAKADALLLRSRLAKIVGRARIKTVSRISPGDLMDLRSIGERFSGIALVSGVRYELSGESWMLDVQFGLSNEWKLEQLAESNRSALNAFVPSVSGLHIAQVVQIHEDPEEANRVKVRLPMLDANEDGTWARLAALDAGQNRGSFFMPEVDDEVIVGFINGDPKEAVILGMLHSAAKAPPLTAEEENPQKGFFSREGVNIVFDDEKKALTVETPGGNKLLLSDEEKSIALETSNGNKLVLNNEENIVTLQSADGHKLILNDGGKISIQAQGDVIINGGSEGAARQNDSVEVEIPAGTFIAQVTGGGGAPAGGVPNAPVKVMGKITSASGTVKVG